MNINELKKFIIGIVFLVILFVGFSFNQDKKNFQQIKVNAGDQHNLSGYAWSDNIGWISFNCLDEGTCGTINYGVNIESNNELSGYAWSDNIGWISFNESDLASCPKGTCKAKLVAGSLTGWAKALSANGNGWDGWISLATQPSESISYGVTLNESELNGFAWGSDIIGWIDFSPSYSGVLMDAFNPPVIAQFNIENVVNGGTPTISWITENATSCQGDWATGNLCSSEIDCASGSTVGPPVIAQTVYTLTCEGFGGQSIQSETPSAYYNLKFIDGYDENLGVEFVISGATTTKTKIGVTPWNGFSGNVTLSAQLNLSTPEPLPIDSNAIYSDQTLSPSEYNTGSDFSIFVAESIFGAHTVPISGNTGILSGVDIIINAAGINPIWQEI